MDEFTKIYEKVDKEICGPKINHLFSDMEIVKKTWTRLGLKYTPNSYDMFLGIYRSYVRNEIKKNVKMIELFK